MWLVAVGTGDGGSIGVGVGSTLQAQVGNSWVTLEFDGTGWWLNGFLSEATLQDPQAAGTNIFNVDVGTQLNDIFEVTQIASPGNNIRLGGGIDVGAFDTGSFVYSQDVWDFKVNTWYSIVVPDP